jgi:hypothetical protein
MALAATDSAPCSAGRIRPVSSAVSRMAAVARADASRPGAAARRTLSSASALSTGWSKSARSSLPPGNTKTSGAKRDLAGRRPISTVGPARSRRSRIRLAA